MNCKLCLRAVLLIFFFSTVLLQSSLGQEKTLPASSLYPFGRYDWNEKKELELISSAVNFGFSFSGTECKLFAHLSDTAAHSYLQYELDGVYQKRIKLIGDSMNPIIIQTPTNGKHVAWIYKTTEAQTGPVYIEKITGKDLQPVKRPNLPVI